MTDDNHENTRPTRAAMKLSASKRGNTRVIIVFLVLILAFAVIAVGVHAAMQNGNNANDRAIPLINKTGTLKIEVDSNHYLFTAHYILFIDGQPISQFDIGPLGSSTYTKTVTLPAGASSANITVKVTSTGGGTGNQQDQKTVTVYANNISSVKLSA